MKVALLGIALLLSAFFSGSETAFISVNLIEVQIWLKRKLPFAKWAYYFIHHPDRYLITILIGNNIAIVMFSSLSAYYMEPYLGYFLVLLFNSVFLLIFGEIIPKSLLREMAHGIVRVLAIPLMLFRWIFYPVYLILNFIASFLMRLLGHKNHNLIHFFTKKDMEVLIREGVKTGEVNPSEKRIINRVFRFSNRRVRDVLIPRTEMITLPVTATIKDARLLFNKYGYSRLPVTGMKLDDIRGVLYAKDLLERPATIEEIMRDVLFVPQNILCSELMYQMQRDHITFAIAVDEYGGVAGLVTIEDIIEELFGEISDEFDVPIRKMRRLSDNEYIINGRTEVHFINEVTGWRLPIGNYETVSGMLLERLGRIPEGDEEVQIDGYVVTVLRASKKRIRLIKIREFQPMKDEKLTGVNK